MSYKLSAGTKKKCYKISTLSNEIEVIKEDCLKVYSFDKEPVNIYVNGDPLIDQRVTDLENANFVCTNNINW